MRETNKAALSQNLGKESTSEEIPENSSCIIRCSESCSKHQWKTQTFKEDAGTLRKAMSEKGSCNRVDLVFDVYKQKSIKAAERRN